MTFGLHELGSNMSHFRWAKIHTEKGNPSDHQPYRYLPTPHFFYLHIRGSGDHTYIKVLNNMNLLRTYRYLYSDYC